jgi:hypothetical protein
MASRRTKSIGTKVTPEEIRPHPGAGRRTAGQRMGARCAPESDGRITGRFDRARRAARAPDHLAQPSLPPGQRHVGRRGDDAAAD